MSFYQMDDLKARLQRSAVEDDVIGESEPSALSAGMSREFGPGVLKEIYDEVLPDAIERGDRALAEKCERVLAKHGMALPNRVSGLWEPLDVPRNEVQVRELFTHRLPEFGYQLVASHTDFPDWLLLNNDGEYVYCEVEHRSSSFLLHGHDPTRCDLLACWEHDWPACPFPALEFFSGVIIAPTVSPPEPMSRARLMVNFAGTLTRPTIKSNFGERKQRGEWAVRRYNELREASNCSDETICRTIGDELGTTSSAARQLLKIRGLLGPVRPRRRAILDRLDEVRGDYDTKSAAIEAVARQFGIAPGTVWSHVSKGR